ncbi:hypothetical protein NE237_032364 [Protea cynaroides]|uniref:Uncharacterized protein n=1 Tax=Protea cynaroides TaxID=273540 RepID=A0A9Q0L363_9MAGN|nr:hypothetical protein NE237_032364 [Protea cynaroides]
MNCTAIDLNGLEQLKVSFGIFCHVTHGRMRSSRPIKPPKGGCCVLDSSHEGFYRRAPVVIAVVNHAVDATVGAVEGHPNMEGSGRIDPGRSIRFPNKETGPRVDTFQCAVEDDSRAHAVELGDCTHRDLQVEEMPGGTSGKDVDVTFGSSESSQLSR